MSKNADKDVLSLSALYSALHVHCQSFNATENQFLYYIWFVFVFNMTIDYFIAIYNYEWHMFACNTTGHFWIEVLGVIKICGVKMAVFETRSSSSMQKCPKQTNFLCLPETIWAFKGVWMHSQEPFYTCGHARKFSMW